MRQMRKSKLKEDLKFGLKKRLTDPVPEIREICRILLANQNKWDKDYIEQVGDLRVKKLRKLVEDSEKEWDKNIDKLSEEILKGIKPNDALTWAKARTPNLSLLREHLNRCSFFQHLLISLFNEDFREDESFLDYI